MHGRTGFSLSSNRNRQGSLNPALSLLAGVCFLAAALLARAQPLSFSTLAGSPGGGSADGPGAGARLAHPWGVAADSAGNLYVTDTDNHTLRQITPAGVVTTLAGQPGVSGSANGTGSGARFNQPQGVAVDAVGNVYVADTGNHTIRKITSLGVVTTLAGLAGSAGSTDNTGSAARFNEPEGLTLNSAGTLLYVADTWNHTLRQVTTAAGVVTTLAGLAGTAGTNDGTGTGALFNQPQGVAVDGSGNVYVGDTGNQTVRKVTASGTVTTWAGMAGNFGSANGSGSSAAFWGPQGLAVDGSGTLFVADSLNHTIRKVTAAGAVTTWAGTAGSFGSAEGTGSTARFWLPQSVALDGSGNLYVADSANGTIRKITSTGVVTTLAGAASAGSADGSGESARFAWPAGVALDSAGNSFVADSGNGTIRKVSPLGEVTTLAGSAGSFGSANGSGTNARFYAPQGVAVDNAGNAYVADSANHTLRKITPGGTVSTLAGTAGVSGVDDGTGAGARFNVPQDVAVDTAGNVYVADTWNHTLRKVTAAGVVTTLAGVPGCFGDLDDGNPANGTNDARFYCPSGVAVDTAGNLYVADTRNHTIRQVTPAGIVSTIAGQAGIWGSADGTNTNARFNLPQALALDVVTTNLYVLDSGNHTLRRLALLGTNWVVSTVAGLPGASGSTDGVGTNARFSFPAGLGINNVGALSVADWGNNTLRAGNSVLNSKPVIVAQPQDQATNQGASAAFSVNAAGTAPLAYQWRFYGTNLSGATTSSLTMASAQPADAGPYAVVITNSLGSVTSATAQLTVFVAPTLTNAPQSLTINQYSNATFSVSAAGNPLSYQWLFNGATLAAATDSSFTRPNVQPGDAGSYSVVVFNFLGSTTSPPAVLTVTPVPSGPSILTPPQDQAVNQSANATFSVTAAGTPPPAYQWRFYGTNLPGATASSYALANVQPANAGPYAVVLTNLYGALTSASALLSVVVPPIISVQPSNQLAAVSNSVTFTVGLSQGTSPAYQWRQNGTPISGATLSRYTIPSVLWADAGTYSVVITNSAGPATSAGATLQVQQAAFTFFDGFENYNLGLLDNNFSGPNTTASNPWWTFSVSTQGAVTNAATGVAPHGGSRMAGRAPGSAFEQDYLNLIYRLNAGQPYDGNFLCEWWFYDPCGTGTGAANYADYMVVGSYAPISATTDATTTGFSIYQRMSLGAYNGSGYDLNYYQARIMNGAGSFGSGNSWYNTATPRTVGWHHARIVFGIPSAHYAPVWMYIDNMTNATVYSPTSGTNTGFTVIEMNHANSGSPGYYDDVSFRAANDPWIVEQPLNQAVKLGQPAYFNTVAIGTAYQWQFNGANLTGATTSAYSLAAVAATNAGSYACLISGANGTLTSTPAVLTITDLPAQPGQFTSLNLTNGALLLNMSGTPYTNYVLEYTRDWTSWLPLATLSGPSGTFQYTDPSPVTNTERFYRLRVAP
jgi:sugar lactone lactonase YvrE